MKNRHRSAEREVGIYHYSVAAWGHEALSDLLVLMCAAFAEDVTKALTMTARMAEYLESKRELESTKLQIEKFTETLRLLEEQNISNQFQFRVFSCQF